MNNKRKLRMILLGVLCGGLLLAGIGAGICAFEFSGFSYGGSVVPMGENYTVTETFQVGKETAPVYLQSLLWNSREPLDTLTAVKTDASMEKGTVRVRVCYRKMPGMEVNMYIWQGEQQSCISLQQYTESELAMLVSYKDDLLADLKSRELHEYLPIHVESVEITVNPADEGRIRLDEASMDTVPVVEVPAYETEAALDEY